MLICYRNMGNKFIKDHKDKTKEFSILLLLVPTDKFILQYQGISPVLDTTHKRYLIVK